MAKKNYYGGSTPVHKGKTAEHVAMLRRVADEMPSDYEAHAKTIRNIADHLDKSQGQSRTKNVVGKADRKGHPID